MMLQIHFGLHFFFSIHNILCKILQKLTVPWVKDTIQSC